MGRGRARAGCRVGPRREAAGEGGAPGGGVQGLRWTTVGCGHRGGSDVGCWESSKIGLG